MEQTAQELLRALRGERSQVAMSRRLGYRSNVAADWEQGRRFPTAAEAFRAAERVGIDVGAAMRDFAPTQDAPDPTDADALATWLDGLRGSRPVTQVARQCDRSRHAVGRWLSGRSQPRLPDFLRLVDAMTGRVVDLLALLAPLDALPSVAERARRTDASRRVGVEQPWSSAVIMALESVGYAALPGHSTPWLAQRLGIPEARVDAALERLGDAGIVRWQGGRFAVHSALTIDTRTHPDGRDVLRRHWSAVAAERAMHPHDDDVLSYNLFGVSRTDLARIVALQRAMYREVRSIVAASEPVEAVALMHLHTLSWDVSEGDVPGPGTESSDT